MKAALTGKSFNRWVFVNAPLNIEHCPFVLPTYNTILIVKENKGNSIAGAVQMEANLQEQINDHLQIRRLKCC